MTETLERESAVALPWRQRYKRWERVHQRRTTVDAVLGMLACLLVVAVMGVMNARAEAPAPPADDPDGTVLSMAMVGDIMFGRHVDEVVRNRGLDHPLSHVADHLASADYVTGNLEQAILAEDPGAAGVEYPEAEKLIHLWSGPETAQALADVGFTTLNLANNHAMDYGELGLADTLDALEDAGLSQAGAGASLQDATDILYEDIGGVTVATLGFTDVYVGDFTAQSFRGGVVAADPDVIGPTVREAAEEADLVVAHVHWGDEYDWRPRSEQIELGRQLAEEGVDIVIGHHPHVLMPVEVHGDSVIFYSLGNFVFDQGWTRTRESVIAGYELAEDGTATIELTPTYVREGRPRPLQGWISRYRQARVFSQLTGRADGWEREGDVLRLELDHGHVLDGVSSDGE